MTGASGGKADKYKEGDRVFAKLHGWPPWPAKVIERCVGKVEKYFVIFYGTHDSAEVKPQMMYPYTEENIGKYGRRTEPPTAAFRKAMEEIERNVRLRTPVEKLEEEMAKVDVKTPEVIISAESNGAESKMEENNETDDGPMLFELQHDPDGSSETDCVLKCYDGEIHIHAVLFRNWLVEQSENGLPEKLLLDLKIWNMAELAPIILLLYGIVSGMKLHTKAKQAFKKIQHSLGKVGFHIKIPEVTEGTDRCDPEVKFRCVKTTNGERKWCYYVVSAGIYAGACEECRFSGSAEEMQKHVQDSHGMIGPTPGSTLTVPEITEETKKLGSKSDENETLAEISQSQSSSKSPKVSSLHGSQSVATPQTNSIGNGTIFIPVKSISNGPRLNKAARCKPAEEIIAEKKARLL